jgi:hypothetical protein
MAYALPRRFLIVAPFRAIHFSIPFSGAVLLMATAIDRVWIATELAKGIVAEQTMATDAAIRADSPPEPELSVLYHEIAAHDERHAQIVETVATRYGYTPTRDTVGRHLGAALDRLKEKVSALGSNPWERLAQDLAAKANAVHWYTAWIQAFEAIGDATSAQEFAAALAEEQAHRDALQEGLNRMVTRGAQGAFAPGVTS